MEYNSLRQQSHLIKVRKWDLCALPQANMILLTHERRDLLNLKALESLRTDKTIIVLNEKCAKQVKGGIIMRNVDVKTIDYAFLPMNLPCTMTPEIAADAAKAFKPKVLYPYHYGDTDPSRIVELMKDTPFASVICNSRPNLCPPRALVFFAGKG